MPPIRNVSDTAAWAAVYRARESERPDALFRDPYARRLAGERGEEIARLQSKRQQNDWAWVGRTVLFDQFITEQLAQGVDTVVNLAAGLDARPYRMNLPPSLRWIEADLPGILDYKESILAGEKPVCQLERIRVDLADERARRTLLLDRIAAESKNALVLSEGLIVYLSSEANAQLARDLAAVEPIRHWVLDILSPALRKMLMKQVGAHLQGANAPLLFAPAEGPSFFEAYGWKVEEVRSPLQFARHANRLPWLLRLFARLPEPPNAHPGEKRIWSAMCLLRRVGG
ncbi:MAG TPA: SAM-dependent methyltransferase [Thermoanaerobaculia bacterium]|jgi:methyltransferase (TIGR00027 family)